jgi:hypothetical protein
LRDPAPAGFLLEDEINHRLMPGEVSRTVMNIDATFFYALEGGVRRHAFVLLASND